MFRKCGYQKRWKVTVSKKEGDDYLMSSNSMALRMFLIADIRMLELVFIIFKKKRRGMGSTIRIKYVLLLMNNQW